MKIKLTGDALRQFGVAKIFQESDEQKRSICFSQDGQRLVVCDHQNMIVYSCTALKQLCQVLMHQYHPESVCFTPQTDQLLHSSTRMDFALRCLDLRSRQHVRLFRGHTAKVRCLSFQPGSENHFMSAGRDNKVLMWDLRTSSYTRQLAKLECPLLAYDPAGLVFATSTRTELIEIYDVRMLSEKPCQKFHYVSNNLANWTQLQFAPDGKTILLATNYSCCFSVDAFNGSLVQAYTGHANDGHLPLQVSYTPDSQFVLSGADGGRVHVWNASSGQLVAVLLSNSNHPVSCLQFNPQTAMFVSSDVMTLFWLPKADGQYDFVEDTQAQTQSSIDVPTIDLTITDDSDQEEVQTRRQQMRKNRVKRRLSHWRRFLNGNSLEEGELPDDN
ncbi:WD repeat-containing protein 82 [Drosophila innubila]|uniref:WD repeat-containing protein 82 n=1 Tax=Drosophila innubila TaxID=198719 RepID=UPI00148D0273|nr:WD repeat-containing protein 82 [Drosophila innubila]